MPVVQPYAISSRFATSGKINLNHQLLPFPYIRRETALHGLFKGEVMTAVPADQSWQYKAGMSGALKIHRKIDLPQTLKQWDTRYAGGKVFRTSSEICSVHLVPETFGKETKWTAANMADFWKINSLTGDEVRERPYTSVQTKATAQSNTWRLHYRVQTLVHSRAGPPDVFEEGRDRVIGERRGSVLMERYLDPSEEWVEPSPEASWSVEDRYRFRVVSQRRFSP
jgi:uncharacterized protein (TIGR02600 family)